MSLSFKLIIVFRCLTIFLLSVITLLFSVLFVYLGTILQILNNFILQIIYIKLKIIIPIVFVLKSLNLNDFVYYKGTLKLNINI